MDKQGLRCIFFFCLSELGFKGERFYIVRGKHIYLDYD